MKLVEAIVSVEQLLGELRCNKNAKEIAFQINDVCAFLKQPHDKIVPNLNRYKKELLFHCNAVVGLEDGFGHSSRQHYSWALNAFQKLKSYHCININ